MRSFKAGIFATVMALVGLFSVSVTAQETEGYSQAELDQMLAPIALYPDTVLSHVLIASTYPLEVVQAARWARNNPGYSGQEAVAMVEDQDWDPSVKALVAFPELLDRMDQDIGWTQGLGDAFLAQEGEVADTIQNLRNQAYANGQLQSNAQVNVVRETRYIYIEPAQPQVVYVPYYDPRIVYGPWRWAAYPPVYWHHPPGYSVSLGYYWGVGYYIQPSFYFSSFYWPSRHVVVVDHHYHNHYRNYGYGRGHGGYRPAYHMAHYDGARRWQHNSPHRRGVSYRGDINQDRFSQRDSDGGRDRSSPGRTAQTRGMQRDWADQQRTRLVDNADNNTARDGRQRSRDSASGRRPAPLEPAGDNGQVRPERSSERTRQGTPERTPERIAGQNTPRSNEGAIERLRRDLADAGQSRRSGTQPVAPGSTPRTRQAESNRSVLPASAGQPVVERRGQNTRPARESRAVTQTPDRRVTSPTRDAGPARETRYAAAAPQRSQRPLAAQRQAQRQHQIQPQRQAQPQREAQPQRQAQSQHQERPSREGAPARQARGERGSKPERAAHSQR